MLSQKELKELLDYQPETGDFYYKINTIKYKIGDKVGRLDCSYLQTTLPGSNRKYKLHRLAWLYVYGYWPNIIDHINQIKTDNRIVNLRDVNARENACNRPIHRKKLLGAILDKRRNRWYAQYRLGKNKIHLGMFSSAEEAHKAYIKATQSISAANE